MFSPKSLQSFSRADMSSEKKQIREFGKLRLDVDKKVLWHAGQPVSLPLKEIELLCALTENVGEVVTKDELLEKIWAESFVEEGNLSRHIYLLRKTLKDLGESDELIQTVPRRGYRFAGEVRELHPGELVIEKHTLTQTLIEEVTAGDDSTPQKALSSSTRFRLPAKILIPAALALAIIAAGVILLQRIRTNAGNPPAIRSIAVLPLKSLSDRPDDRALSLGFADALLTSLGRISEVRLISVSGGDSLGDLRSDPSEIGKKLDADCVFDGTLQRANGKIRVTLRLIRTRDGRQLWNGLFDENENEVFRLEDAMAVKAAESLALDALPVNAKRPTENRDAYEAYLRGRFFFDKRTPENYDKAVAEFERAIGLDPNYVLAYSGLADVYALKANDRSGEERDALYEKARATALKALDLDEGSAEAHTSLGWIKRIHDWDWAGSEREFKRALVLNPRYVNAHQWYALLLITLSRPDEALAEIEKARELEPLSTVVLLNYFSVRQYRREKDLLLPLAERVVSLDNSPSTRARLFPLAYSRANEHAKVIELVETLLSNGDYAAPTYLTSNLALAYSNTGQESKARAMIDHLRERAKDDSEAAYRLATFFAAVGNREESIQLLQQCVDAHDDRLVWIRVEPLLDSIRDDERYLEILSRMKLL
jgi:DNA-binding winged helix-turn-helix (wHTH) protein/TolB-like protein/Flp pilus assembly protein TadD